jgi:hypothetical protein
VVLALVTGAGTADAASATPSSTQSYAASAVASHAGTRATASTAWLAPTARATFDPGYIISDDNFYDSESMSSEQIQRFLKHANCRPKDDSPCLADFRQTTQTQPVRYEHCDRYAGETDERASRIISKVATACGISPIVLLVLVQKEQSLVTRPSAYGYQRATGYACPDTADCDAAYFGFFNQLYNAAWQFREYGDSQWRYHVGSVRVQYHPDASCGSSVVRIKNQATANLYNYTPYQPNRATIARPDGPSDACSTYGNLNFSRIYTRWFGSPLSERFPSWWGGCLNLVGGHRCVPESVPPAAGASAGAPSSAPGA